MQMKNNLIFIFPFFLIDVPTPPLCMNPPILMELALCFPR